MKKIFVRVERAVIKFALLPELRPLEDQAAKALALKVLARVGAPSVIVGVVLELIAKYLGA